MARIPQSEIERLKRDVSLVQLVEAHGIELSGHGDNLLGLCPFHDDRNPSLVVSPKKNVWHCLGACQAGGSVIDWVMRAERVPFVRAVERLRKGATILVAKVPPAPLEAAASDLPPPDEPDAVVLRRVALEEYPGNLRQCQEPQAYLEKRGLRNAEMVEHFHLGYSNRTLGLRIPSNHVKAGAVLRAQLQRVGLIRESGHEHMRGSLTIPILGEDGEVLDLYGRKVGEAFRKGTPRHLYLPARPDGRRGVFNVDAFRASKDIILCEAILDALSFWAAGHRNVTTAYGVEGFTKEIRDTLIEHRTKRVLIAYDADDAGDRAAEKLAPELAELGVEVFRVRFPAGTDANEYAVQAESPAKAFEQVIGAAQQIGGPRAVAVPEASVDATPARATTSDTGTAVEASTPTDESESQLTVAAELDVNAEPTLEAPMPADQPELFTTPQLDTGAAEPCVEAEHATMNEPLLAPRASQPDEIASTPATDESPFLAADSAPKAAEPAIEGQPVAALVDAEVHEDEVRIRLGDRRWRIRGFGKNTSYDSLRVNLLVAVGDAFYVDSLELYSARHRAAFLKDAARELKQDERVLKADVTKVILRLEDLVHQRIQQAVAPAKRIEMSEMDREAALELLRDPDLLRRILDDFDKAGVVGEETNKLVGYLAVVSRKLDAPLAVVIQSSSAAGKSSLMDAVLRFIPEEDRVQYTAMTGQSLFYMGETDLTHKILAIAEEQGAQSAAYALKLLQSEGELSIASTGKDPATGKLVTHNYRVKGPVMLFLTTTAVEVDEELLNRCIVLTVDEGAGQTSAIHARQREAQTLEGLLTKRTKEARILVHQNAQRLLEPLSVVNPLAKNLRFSNLATRTRRDHMKYLSLIQAIALLHQHQRPIKEVDHLGKRIRYIEVVEADIAIADRLVKEVLGGSLDELPPQTRRLLDAIDRMVTAEAARQGVEKSAVRFSRKDVREHTRWGDTALKKHLGRLEDLEHLLVHGGGARRRMVYELATARYDRNLGTPPASGHPLGRPSGHGGGCPDSDANVLENLELVTLAPKALLQTTAERREAQPYHNGSHGPSLAVEKAAN